MRESCFAAATICGNSQAVISGPGHGDGLGKLAFAIKRVGERQVKSIAR
jgi:hypothetical protein